MKSIDVIICPYCGETYDKKACEYLSFHHGDNWDNELCTECGEHFMWKMKKTILVQYECETSRVEDPEPPKPRPLIYIAGPYTAYDPLVWFRCNGKPINYYDYAQIDRNIERAMQKKAELMEIGFAVICPHANSARMERTTDLPYEVFLEEDIVMLRRCDAVYFLRGYHESKGALKELDEAQKAQIDCVFEGEADEAEVLRQILNECN